MAGSDLPIEERSLDVLVRDFPETLACLRAAGIDPAVSGLDSLRSRSVPPEVVEEVRARIAWRTA